MNQPWRFYALLCRSSKRLRGQGRSHSQDSSPTVKAAPTKNHPTRGSGLAREDQHLAADDLPGNIESPTKITFPQNHSELRCRQVRPGEAEVFVPGKSSALQIVQRRPGPAGTLYPRQEVSGCRYGLRTQAI